MTEQGGSEEKVEQALFHRGASTPMIGVRFGKGMQRSRPADRVLAGY